MKPEDIIGKLNLKPHAREDGYFVETYRSPLPFPEEALPEGCRGPHCASTAIYFLLVESGFSEMHRLPYDEVYHYYGGDPSQLLLLGPDGSGRILLLGDRLDRGEQPQIIVPGRWWQGSRTTGQYTLFGCTCAPGFEYPDYEAGPREALLRQYPAFSELINQLTRL